jgi:tetratricopeptide (TPR) repeat protein
MSMGFFNKMFGGKSTDDASAGGSQGVDFTTALGMHLRGEIDQALNAYLMIAEKLPEDNLAPFFASAIRADKGDIGEAAESLRDLSRCFASRGETISRALSLELVALMSDDPFISVSAVAEVIVSFGDHLKKQDFVQESAVCFEIATGLVPDHAQVLFKLGDTLHDLRIYDYAESVLREALKYASHHWGALYTYAVLLQDLGRIPEAIAYYEKALKIDPDHAKSQNNYGAALMMANRLEDALVHCSLAAELDPTLPWAKINLGNIHMLMHSYEAARTCFAEAISLDGSIALGYFGLGSVEELLGSDTERIRELYLKAIDLNPTYPEAHHALGNLLARDGKQEALSHFSAAAQLNNTLVNLHRDFGNACLNLGHREKAREHLTLAVQQNPNDDKALEILATIGE